MPDPPLLVYLASRLLHSGVDAAMLGYLEVLGRAVSDLHLDVEERRILVDFAHESGLTDAHLAQAHRRYTNDLTDFFEPNGRPAMHLGGLQRSRVRAELPGYALTAAAAVYAALRSVALSERRRIVGLVD